MKARFLILSAATVALFSFAATLGAQPPRGFRQRPDKAATATAPTPGDRQARLEQMLTRFLQLNTTQQNQVHTFLEEGKVASQGVADGLPDLRKSLLAAIKANHPAEIDALTQQISTMEQQVSANRAKTAAKIYAILTDPQRTALGNGLGMLLGGGPGGPGGAAGRRRGPPPPAPAQ